MAGACKPSQPIPDPRNLMSHSSKTHPLNQCTRQPSLHHVALACVLVCAGLAGASDARAQNQAAAVKATTPENLPKLSEIVVTAPKPETDGSGSYTSPAVTVAGKTPLPLREIPNSVSVLTRQQMDDMNLVTTWDAFTQITGVQAIANDSMQGQYYARGNALDIRMDGAPSLFPLSGNQQFDLAIYDRIEVQRGPTGVLQGSGSFAGTVNLVKKRPTDTFAASVLGTLGSWNNKRLEADISGPLNANKSVRGRVVASVQDKEWFVNRFTDKKQVAYGVVEADLTRATTLRASVARQHDESPGFSGLPTYTNGVLLSVDRSFNPNPAWNRSIWDNTEYAVDLEHRFDNQWVGKARVSRREAAFFFKDSYLLTGITPATGTGNYTRREFDYDYVASDMDVNVSGPFTWLGRTHNLMLGANASRYTSDGKGVNRNQTGMQAVLDVNNVLFADPPAVPEITVPYKTGSASVTRQHGAYGQARFSVTDPLTLVLGGRFSHYANESRTTEPAVPTAWSQGAQADGRFTPYAGAVLDLSQRVALYASYSDIFVPQTQKRVDGSVLDPRVGKQVELGVKGEYFDGKLNTALALFNIKDVNRSYADAANPGYFLAMGEVESNGWEAEVSGSPAPGWNLTAGYTYLVTRNTVNSTVTSVGQPISYWYPMHTLKLWSNYRVSGGSLDGLSWGVGVNGQSETASGTSTATVAAREQGAYAVVAAQLGYRFSKNLSGTLTVNNLFDKAYFTRIQGTNTYMSYGEPRNVTLALRATF